MSIQVKVRVHESGEVFFAREGTYEKNKDGRLVPGYYLITPLGDRWHPCSECSAIDINGMPIGKGAQEDAEQKQADIPKGSHASTHGGRAAIKNPVGKRTGVSSSRRSQSGGHLPKGGD